jgi:acetyltransferase-like isoleucine patch superfamily enzyme
MKAQSGKLTFRVFGVFSYLVWRGNPRNRRSGKQAAKGRRDLWRPTKVGDGVSVGTNATILPVTICDRTVIGAGAVVTRNITEPGIYAGNPARLLRQL